MNALAFVVLAGMLTAYVLLDGYDLGAGIVSLFVARDRAERGAVMASIGPVWNGNEVWLIAAGGTLFALFPLVYAAAFSGFYLPLMVVLWLLMFRGIALELRSHLEDELWQQFFDVTFAVSSALLALLFGVAFGNVVRGVPLDAQHQFTGTFSELLNPYALGVGLLAVLALGLHGAARVAVHVDGVVAERARVAVGRLWPVAAVLTVLLTIATFAVRSPIANLQSMPLIAIAPLAMIAGFIGVFVFARRGNASAAFTASTIYLAGMLAAAAATLFPYLLPGYPDAANGLRIDTQPLAPAALATLLAVVIAGLVLVGIYRAIVVRRFAQRSAVGKEFL